MTAPPKVQPDIQIVILSGPSGSGKTTVVDRLLKTSPVRLIKSISVTTRAPRKGEVEGDNYHFLTHEQFREHYERGDFVECFEVHGTGNWYGTLHEELQRARDIGGWALLEIDVQGAKRVVEQYPDAVTIFLRTASIEEYEERLRRRGTESEEAIQRRLANARSELASADWYAHVVINDDLERAVGEISEILATKDAEIHA